MLLNIFYFLIQSTAEDVLEISQHKKGLDIKYGLA